MCRSIGLPDGPVDDIRPPPLCEPLWPSVVKKGGCQFDGTDWSYEYGTGAYSYIP